MESAVSVLSPSSWERRRAWAKQSRLWHSVAVEEEGEAETVAQDTPELQSTHLDDVFLQGSSSNKIESWLQECGFALNLLPEEICAPATHGACSNATSFEDDLTLGAEALLLPWNDKTGPRKLLEKPRPGHHLNLGHSLTSSALSSGTNKTSSSISELLDRSQADAETILYNLGFVREEPQATARIPARFFATPSHAQGIDFQLFLKAQVRRLEMEDPCLALASRFQQVQTLAATADAFFCLYSYVSKTPVQKLSPTYLSWGCPELPDIHIVPSEPETLSPSQRLQRAVSRMCLYTPPRQALSARSPKSSLEEVVQEVLDLVRGERFRFEPVEVRGKSCQWETERSSPEPAAPISASSCFGAPACSGEKTESPKTSQLELGPVQE